MMICRTIVALLALGCLTAAARTDQPAGKQDDGAIAAQALIDRAVKASGGAERLGKIQAVSAQVEGAFHTGARKAPITFSATAHGCLQYRIEVDTFADNQLGVILVGNGDKSWIKGTDPTQANFNKKLMPLKELLFDAGLAHDLYAVQLTQFLPALKSKDFKLSATGEIKIDDRAAVGFGVSRPARPDVNIYLDKETALPIKCELRIRSDKTNQEFTHEIRLGDFKETDGVKHFTKLTVNRDGTKIFEAELNGFQFLAMADAKIFAEP